MLLEKELEKNLRMKGFNVDHISLVIPADKKSKFGVRRKKENILNLKINKKSENLNSTSLNHFVSFSFSSLLKSLLLKFTLILDE